MHTCDSAYADRRLRHAGSAAHPVDEVLPLPQLAALGLQHVLVMYANAVAVPLILGGALHLPKDQIAMLINADLFACGIATLIQTIGFGPFGIRLPIIMGVTAVSISPMLAMAAMPGVGLTGIYGAVLVGGLFGLCVAPFVKYVLRFFPAVVTGTIITMIGVVLMRVGISWAGGGAGGAGFRRRRLPRASPALVLAVILLVIKFAQRLPAEHGGADRHRGRLSASPSRWAGPTSPGIGNEPLVRIVLPLQFGLPQFHLVPCLTMCLVMTIVFIEATGMFLALGAMTGRAGRRRGHQARPARRCARHPDRRRVQHVPLCLLFAEHRPGRRDRRLQPLGLRRRRRHHAGARAACRSWPSSSPRCRNACSAAPGFIMFGMVAATGIKILSTVDFTRAAQQRAGRRDLDRLRPDPDRLAEFLPHLAGRAEADLRRRHHPDLDRGGAAERLLQPHQPRTGRGRRLPRRAGRRAHLRPSAPRAKGCEPCARPSKSPPSPTHSS